MGTTNSEAKGMLSREAARKSFMATLVDLYKSDLAFRGMTDFAIIGALAMMFLDPPNKVQWPWSGGGPPAFSGSGQRSSPSSIVAPNTMPPDAGPKVPSPAGPAVAIPFPDELKNPRIDADYVFAIDAKPFSSSSAADQPRLAAARTAVSLWQPENAIEDLRPANGNDPNVQLMRGAAFAISGNAQTAQTAEALWRQAIYGGSIQAKALLGRTLMVVNANSNAREAQQLIESGAAAGDPQAMRLAGIGYLSGEFGLLDPPKGAEYLKRGADAGDAMAMAVYARVLADGIGLPAADPAQSERYLRQAANAGLTLAQSTLGDWLKDQYGAGLLPDPKEAIAWLRRAYEQGHSLAALTSLVALHERVAKVPPWQDIPRAMAYLRLCSGLEYGPCQFEAGAAWKYGYFGSVNKELARAHLQIAMSLNDPRAADIARNLDKELSPSQIEEASGLEQKIRGALRPTFPLIPLQYEKITSPPPPSVISPDLQDLTGFPDVSGGIKAPGNGESVNPGSGGTKIAELRARAQKHMGEQDYDSAIADFTDVIRQGNASWQDYNQRGMAHHSKREYDLALEDYDRALARNKNSSDVHYNRGLIYQAKGDLDKAIADFTAALKVRDDKDYYLSRGDAYFAKGDFLPAVRDYSKLIDILAKNKATNDEKALGYFLRGRTEVQIAMRAGDTCKTMIPPDPSCNSGTKFMSALLDLEQAVQAKPDYADAHFMIGWIADSIGNRRKAIEAYSAAIQANPKYATAYNNRGVIYGNMGQRDLAMADYNDAIKNDPKNSHAWANRGALYAMMRKRSHAIADLRQAVAIDPTNTYAVDLLRRLHAR